MLQPGPGIPAAQGPAGRTQDPVPSRRIAHPAGNLYDQVDFVALKHRHQLTPGFEKPRQGPRAAADLQKVNLDRIKKRK